MKHIFAATFFLSILYTPCVLADNAAVRNTSGVAADYVDPDPVGSQKKALAAGSELLADPSNIKTDERSAPSDGGEGSADRAYKAENAKSQGKIGSAAAISAYVALEAKARGLEFPAPGVAAALHAMAALELAQSIATAATATTNHDQQRMLTADEQADVSGVKAAHKKSTANISSPELDNYLQKQGVNVDNFKQQLADGTLSSLDDVLNAMGVASRVRESDLKQAERMANNTFKNASVEADSADRASVSGNDNAKGSGVADNSSNTNGSVLGASSASSKADSDNVNNYEVLETQSPAEKAQLALEQASKENSSTGFSGTMSEFLKKFAGDNKQGILERKLTEYEIQMEKANVFPSTGKLQIFQIAHRNYREYGKWRKNAKKLAIR